VTERAKYPEQWERVQRWHERFSDISEGKLHDKPSDFYQDEVYAFFMNCYHLKDWIKHDPTHPSLAGNVESFITDSRDMSLCADIYNGMKHLLLTRPRSHEDPQFGKRHFEVGVGTQPTTIAVKYTIDTTSGPIDAYELATRCVEAWKSFLNQT